MVTEAQAARADELVRQGRAQEDYFFSSLSSPDWIVPLTSLGYFKTPPPAELHGDSLRCSRWPELRYLAAMADKAPALVAELLRGMDVTRNYLVHDDQVRICLLLPPDDAAKIVAARLSEWVEPPFSFSLPRQLATLARRLGESGQPGQATAIVSKLVALEPPETSDESGDSYMTSLPSPRLGDRNTDYSHTLDGLSGGVGSATGSALLEMTKALAHVLTSSDDDAWCRDVSQSSARRYDARGALLHLLARYGILLGESEPTAFDRAIDLLNEFEHSILRRVRLELLARFPAGREARIQAALSDPTMIEACGASFEFRRLAASQFHALEEPKRIPYLEWLAREPDPERVREFRRFFGLPDPTDDEIRESHEVGLRDALHVLRDSLPTEWRARYDALVEAHGDAIEHRMSAEETVARNVADASPYEVDHLSGMTIDALVQLLRDWRPPQGARIEEPTIGALAKRLEQAVQARPAEVSATASSFIELDPAYVSAVLSGIGKSVAEGHPVQVAELFRLCEWTLDQQGLHAREGIAHPYEVSWDWAQGHVAELLQKLLQGDPPSLLPEQAPQAWALLTRLCTRPDPRPDQEAEDRDYLTLAINSARGKGLEALFRYLIWLQKQRSLPEPDPTIAGLQDEAWAFLSLRVDRGANSSLADRALFGQWLPNLVALSEPWVRDHVESMFPLEDESRSLLDAAWRSFIVYTPPYARVFEVLADRYTWATSQLAAADAASDTSEHLTQHLMVLYGRGAIALDSEQLRSFWESAPLPVRQHALSFVGYTLPETTEDIDDAAVARFKSLADARIEHYEAGGPGDPMELGSLGVWLRNPLFDDDWVQGALSRTLGLTGGRMDQKAELIERLAQGESLPLPAVFDCLDAMVRAEDDRWWIDSAVDQIKTLLARGIGSGDPVIRDCATALQNHLVGAGYWGFRDLDKKT